MSHFSIFLNTLIEKIIGRHKDRLILTKEHRQALSLFENTNNNLFITGKAGTGKSDLIQYLSKNMKKQVVVLAPTGIAALHVGGQTIHSFFKFPPRLIDEKTISQAVTDKIFTAVDSIIIDEISMVRADLLDGIDLFLRRYGRNSHLPFGGVQMVIVGDLYQLPPVVAKNEVDIFFKLYDSPYFFNSKVFLTGVFKVVELKTIFRQKDQLFIEVLNRIREGTVSSNMLKMINSRFCPEPKDQDSVTLCTTNQVADKINNTKLSNINKPVFTYHGRSEGNFPTEPNRLPTALELHLKIGAKVIFTKNDKLGRWINGSLGIVYSLKEDAIKVRIADTNKVVSVRKVVWENIHYVANEETAEITSQVIGKQHQYPLKLAWAITIHKSQGMSFNKVRIDFSSCPFTHGQTYVALSRSRSLEGLSLSRKINPSDIIIDKTIIDFYKSATKKKTS